MEYNKERKKSYTLQCAEITISEKDVRLQLKKNRIVRAFFMLGGTVSLALGVIGLFVPGLPTTPFVLLSAALYAKSSEKLYNWLLDNKFLGPRIKNYQRQKGVTLKGKYRIIALMLTMVLISTFLILKNVLFAQIIVFSAGIIGAIVVRFVVPTAKEEN
ncbi:MAG: YbaN family protein [Dysgonamonadaceae bacterium]|nr:YbaN family protein [Dysgonamonadaceae bacterium]MDD4728336.1 YbaN family protein [Dysgonamonadaceae bacterium]